MSTNTILYLAIVVAAVFVLLQRLRARKAPASMVREKIESGARIIDVRTAQEFAGSSYPKAKNIPLDQLASWMSDLPKDKPIVLYCASGMRSANAARVLKKAGFTDVINAGSLASMPR